jgi:hypothetical protein
MLFIICFATLGCVITICVTICNVREERKNEEKFRFAIEHGYEQRFTTEHRQSDSYGWVKADKVKPE